MNLNEAHIHLLVNHFPIIGSIFITGMFIIALIFKNVFLQKVSLWFLIVVALMTAIAYVTGDSTKAALESVSHVSVSMIHDHESVARIGLILMFGAGVIALFGVIFYSRKPALPRYLQITVLIVLLVSVVVFVYVGYLGGQINHPEIRSLATPFLLAR